MRYVVEPVKKQYYGKNVVDAFFARAEVQPELPCVYYKNQGKYTVLTWNDMAHKVCLMADFLVKQGIKKGDKLAVYSINRYEWWIADLACLSIGAINVPIYPTNSAEEARYVLDDSDCVICFCGDGDQRDKILSIKKKLNNLKTVIVFDDLPKKAGAISFQDCLSKKGVNADTALMRRKVNSIKGKDIASIVYTSGTTGNPKGVMITHDNFYNNVLQLADVFGDYVDESEIFFSFLPLSHALERTTGYYMPIYLGCSVAFTENLRTIQSDMVEVRPTVIISVPRIYERIHAGVLSNVREFSYTRKKIFNLAMRIALMQIPFVCKSKEPDGVKGWLIRLADKIVFQTLKKAVGMDRLKVAVSGGGPLAVSDAEFLLGIGIAVYEGYGLTETSPVLNVNRPGKIKPGTVGPAMINTEIRLSDEGEILARGPQLMAGYYKNKKATSEALTKDGFYKTGDLGYIDEDGFLTITGRIKDIIVTAGGKNISPQNIENSLKQSSYIAQIAVIGDRRKYLTALIIPDFAELKKWAKKKGLKFDNNDQMINNETVRTFIGQEIEKYSKSFARVEQIKAFTLLAEEWSQASGELTGTLKVKRKVVEEKYGLIIDAMYQKEEN